MCSFTASFPPLSFFFFFVCHNNKHSWDMLWNASYRSWHKSWREAFESLPGLSDMDLPGTIESQILVGPGGRWVAVGGREGTGTNLFPKPNCSQGGGREGRGASAAIASPLLMPARSKASAEPKPAGTHCRAPGFQ